ncbi:MAG: TIGR01777 family oxidoreductase [Bacteroidota bacterium]
MTFQKTILVAGGSGLVGRRLSSLLESRHFKVIRLSRAPSDPSRGIYHWDPSKGEIDHEAIAKADVIINLAGESIAGALWTPWRRRKIINSRVLSTRLLAQTLKNHPNKVSLVINASATGYYGDTGDMIMNEESPNASDFLGTTCKRWEDEATAFMESGKRTVIYRIGIVLSDEGGMLSEVMRPALFRVLTVFGSGMQYQSWIHIDDLCRLMVRAINHEEIAGVYNAVAPGPLTNRNFMVLLGQILGGFFMRIRIPTFFMRMLMGEMAKIVVHGTRVSSKKIEATGFKFTYARADDALRNLLGK